MKDSGIGIIREAEADRTIGSDDLVISLNVRVWTKKQFSRPLAT